MLTILDIETAQRVEAQMRGDAPTTDASTATGRPIADQSGDIQDDPRRTEALPATAETTGR